MEQINLDKSLITVDIEEMYDGIFNILYYKNMKTKRNMTKYNKKIDKIDLIFHKIEINIAEQDNKLNKFELIFE